MSPGATLVIAAAEALSAALCRLASIFRASAAACRSAAAALAPSRFSLRLYLTRCVFSATAARVRPRVCGGVCPCPRGSIAAL